MKGSSERSVGEGSEDCPPVQSQTRFYKQEKQL